MLVKIKKNTNTTCYFMLLCNVRVVQSSQELQHHS